MPSGSKRPTSNVVGNPSSGARSVHTVRAFGFFDVGVKKLATAPLEMVLVVFRFTGGGEMDLSDAFRLLVGLLLSPPLLLVAMLRKCELGVAMGRLQIGGKSKCLEEVNRSGREE